MPSDDAPEPSLLDLETNPEHARRVNQFLRTLGDEELSQGIACSRAFIDRLNGYERVHIRTKAEQVLIQLAKDEQWRRRDIEVRRQARMANYLAMGSLVVAALAFAVSVFK